MRDNAVRYVMGVAGRLMVIHDCEINYVFLAPVLVDIIRAFKATHNGILKIIVFYGKFLIDLSINFFFFQICLTTRL